MVRLLFDNHGVVATDALLSAATANRQHGRFVVDLLLDSQFSFVVSAHLVILAAENDVSGKDILELLLRKDFTDFPEDSVAEVAARFGPETMRIWLSSREGTKVSEMVFEAATRNMLSGGEIILLFLEQQDQVFPITEGAVKTIAAQFGRETMAALIEKRGQDVQITEEVVKAAAGNAGNGKEVMALLLERRGDEITITEEVVKAAAGNADNGKEVMALLLKRRGAETMASITEETFTAAATCGQDRVLDLLSSQNRLISVRHEWRRIAKFYNAAKYGDVRCIEQLILEGTNPDMKNIRGETPLWAATRYYGCEAVVRVLAPRTDVNVNSLSINGRSPLFWPCVAGNERVVAILMDAGADPNIVDENGDTAITVARSNGHDRIAKMLEHQMDNC